MRYLLFTGVKYYALGGAKDFRADFDTADEAIQAGNHFAQHGVDAEWNLTFEFHPRDAWWHVFDTQTKIVVAECGKMKP